jgi:hypothetical protein
VSRAHDGADDLFHQVHVAEAAGATVPLDHLLDRAAEVDVDEFGLVRLGDDGGRSSHCLGVGAVDLDSDRSFDRLEFAALEGLPDAAADRLGREELGHQDIGPEPAADLPERRLGHSGHGGQNEGASTAGA